MSTSLLYLHLSALYIYLYGVHPHGSCRTSLLVGKAAQGWMPQKKRNIKVCAPLGVQLPPENVVPAWMGPGRTRWGGPWGSLGSGRTWWRPCSILWTRCRPARTRSTNAAMRSSQQQSWHHWIQTFGQTGWTYHLQTPLVLHLRHANGASEEC